MAMKHIVPAGLRPKHGSDIKNRIWALETEGKYHKSTQISSFLIVYLYFSRNHKITYEFHLKYLVRLSGKVAMSPSICGCTFLPMLKKIKIFFYIVATNNK